MSEADQVVTYFAVDPHDPTGQEIVLGRGNPNDPDNLASEAFASVDTTDAFVGAAVVAHIAAAAEGEPISRANAAEVLSEALRLARNDQVHDRSDVRRAIRNEETRQATIDSLVDVVRSQPKVPVDDPRTKAVEHVGHKQYRNNFFMRFLEIRDAREGNLNEFGEAMLHSAKKNGIDLLAFYEEHPELCESIVDAYEAAEPYYTVNSAYIELLKLERQGVITEEEAEVFNTAADHPLGFEAIGCYYWDRLNPLLEEAYGYMEVLSPDASKLGG